MQNEFRKARLSIRNLHYRCGSRVLLSDVSFDVLTGEYAAILGPNGVGKTTLLRCILRIVDDWKGEILLNGLSVRRLSQRKIATQIAYVPQTFSTVFTFTVRQFVEMGRFPHGSFFAGLTNEDRKIVEESLNLMGTLDFAERTIDTLSGGERQKVLLTAAFAQRPDLLLLDEPTTFLDYKHQEEIAELLRRINQEKGTTILMVTHDINRAVLDADRIIAFSDQKIAFNGSCEELLQSERLESIFGTEFERMVHPRNGRTIIVPR